MVHGQNHINFCWSWFVVLVVIAVAIAAAVFFAQLIYSITFNFNIGGKYTGFEGMSGQVKPKYDNHLLRLFVETWQNQETPSIYIYIQNMHVIEVDMKRSFDLHVRTRKHNDTRSLWTMNAVDFSSIFHASLAGFSFACEIAHSLC